MTRARLALVLAVPGLVSTVVGCVPAPAAVEVELIQQPLTLSQTAQLLAPSEPLRADNDSVRVCVYPGPGYHVSGRWTVLTPSGREAQVVARVELVNGKAVTLASPSSTGGSLCVQPRLGGPLEAPVRRVRVLTSTPIVAQRIVWQSTAR
jgi:hypothetical protein